MDDFREREQSHSLIFRRDAKECPRADATEVRVKGKQWTRDVWLPWPESENLVLMVQEVARGAFAHGRRDAQDGMRLALGLREDNETSFLMAD